MCCYPLGGCMALTDTQIRKAKPSEKPVKLRDGNGLFLDLRPSGAKYWRCRFKMDGTEGTFTIGSYPDVSLSDARKERDRIKVLAKKGINPNGQKEHERQLRQQAADNSFRVVALEWLERNRSKWTP